ncbi:hypothetical protein ACOMHN_030725 [Nucella lapillus]
MYRKTTNTQLLFHPDNGNPETPKISSGFKIRSRRNADVENLRATSSSHTVSSQPTNVPNYSETSSSLKTPIEYTDVDDRDDSRGDSSYAQDRQTSGNTTTVQPTTGQPSTVRPTTVQPTTVQHTTLQPTTGTVISTRPPNSRVLNLTTPFISQCLRKYQRHYFLADSGQVSFHLAVESLETPLKPMKYSRYCWINITTPATTVLKIHANQLTVPCCSARFHLRDMTAVNRELLATGCGKVRNKVYVSKGNVLILYFALKNRRGDVVIKVSFTSQQDDKPKLDAVYTSPYQGYVQWSMLDEYRNGNPVNYDNWVKLYLPYLHTVMISFPHVDIEAIWVLGCHALEVLRVYTYSTLRNRETLLWEVCNANATPLPTVLKTDAIFLRFTLQMRYSESKGFRVLFTFFNQSQTPLQTADDTWNCSVPYWGKFRHHLECNLESECSEKEDETHCVYSSPGCGPGFISGRDSCYVYVSAQEAVTWSDASLHCLQRGGLLASLNTQPEWEEVMNVLQHRPNVMIYMGLQSAPSTAPHMYQKTFVWMDQSVVYYRQVFNVSIKPFCSVRPFKASVELEQQHLRNIMTVECNVRYTRHFLCEISTLPEDDDDDDDDDSTSVFIPVPKSALNSSSHQGMFTVCPAGHVTHSFLSCDWQSSCWLADVVSGGCQFPGRPLPPSFRCRKGAEHVPYSLVCDFRPDCGDESDEAFCVFRPCQPVLHFDCGNRQCVPQSSRCDGIQHCVNSVDEVDCYEYRELLILHPTPPPAVVHFTADGDFTLWPQNHTRSSPNNTQSSLLDSESQTPENRLLRADTTFSIFTTGSHSCPESHFACPLSRRLPVQYYCLPVYVRCNKAFDCPGREDEKGCSSYSCPGLYRCRDSRVCLHPSHVCDGVSQCPQKDDEVLCGFVCPARCICFGLAFFCQSPFPADHFSQLRFLDASGSEMTLQDLVNNTMLVHLVLRRCHSKNIPHLNFPNLRILDLSYSHVEYFDLGSLKVLNNLVDLSLAANPVQFVFAERSGRSVFMPSLLNLDLSHILLEESDIHVLAMFPNLTHLNLSNTGLDSVSDQGLQFVSQLQVLDLRGCPLTYFPASLIRDLRFLYTVFSDNYKLCCPTMLPEGFNTHHCHAPFDEISSCQDLLRSQFYRLVLALFASLALLGNLTSFGYRSLRERAGSQQSYGIFVHHLCVADFCMGVYLSLVGVADRMYQGSYVWRDVAWRESVLCRVAGFMSLLSSEVSVCIVCLITVDRLLVLHCPFTSLRFDQTTAHVTCFGVWVVGVVMAGVPLFPATEHWKLYSHTAICVPLPLSRSKKTPGHVYSFSIMVVFNFVIFLLIAVGQSAIYWSVRRNSLAVRHSTRPNKDLTIARRLVTVAMTDFLCWFPIGLLAIMAASGYVIAGEVNVALAMLVLPLNSAINPFLYTLNICLEKRQRAREQRLLAVVTAQLKAEVNNDSAGSTFAKAERS